MSDNWMKIRTFLDKYPEFSLYKIRHLIRQSPANGFGFCFRKILGTIYIDPALFFEWINKSTEK